MTTRRTKKKPRFAELDWLLDVTESRQPLSESSPIWVRSGTVSEGPPTPHPERHPAAMPVDQRRDTLHAIAQTGRLAQQPVTAPTAKRKEGLVPCEVDGCGQQRHRPPWRVALVLDETKTSRSA